MNSFISSSPAPLSEVGIVTDNSSRGSDFVLVFGVKQAQAFRVLLLPVRTSGMAVTDPHSLTSEGPPAAHSPWARCSFLSIKFYWAGGPGGFVGFSIALLVSALVLISGW